LFEAQAPEAEAAGLPADWPSFRAYYARIRKAGYYFSNGELEPELAALAVPLLSAEGETLASLSVVAHVRRMAVIDLNKLTQLLQRSARALIDRLD
jgi:DNA-binding IclR family transcriptional regulator